MHQIKLIAVIATIFTISGCSQNRWQVRHQTVKDSYHPPATLGDSALPAPVRQDLTASGLAPVGENSEDTPYITLVAATDQVADATTAGPPDVITPDVITPDVVTPDVVTPDVVTPDVVTPAPAISGMSLADFESLAYANNPAIRELAATTQKAAGFRQQVGLKANPIMGYQGQQLADRQTDQHIAFVEQEFVTGGKLELNRTVLNQAVRAQMLELEAQKLRVATDIRVRFYEALAAQRRVQLISNFQSVTNKGVEMANIRERLAEGSRIDVLQAKVQQNEIDLSLQQANVQFAAAWRGLVAMTGVSHLAATTLVGELPRDMEAKDWDLLKSTIVNSSPEYNAAQTRVAQARAKLCRQDVQAIPNVTVQFGAGVDNATNSGMMNVQVAAPIPVFNKNQGNIAAAQAEFCRASREVQRIEKSIESRLADVSRDYDTSLAAVNKYAHEILPNAAESLKLAELAYEAGETSFLQVLVARRTYFDSNLLFIFAQSGLAQAGSKVDGYMLTGGLDPVVDNSGDDGLRGLTFSQQ